MEHYFSERCLKFIGDSAELNHSVNKGALEIVKMVLDDKDNLDCRVSESKSGTTIIDAGIDCTGTDELGRLIGEICLGGLGSVKLSTMYIGDLELPAAIVGTDYPKISTLASQYAGWTIKVGKYFAMGSGPARALARVEKKLYNELDYKDRSKTSCSFVRTIEPTGTLPLNLFISKDSGEI